MSQKRDKAILFGARATGRLIYDWVKDETDVLCFVDNDSSLWGTSVFGVEVRSPDCIRELEYDRIIIGSWSIGAIRPQLLNLGVSEAKIDDSHAKYTIRARIVWLRDFARLVYDRSIAGNVAEAGVYLGGFASEINAAFPDRTLYLFDTFSGFDARDIPYEEEGVYVQADFPGSSLERVKSVLPHLDKCVIKEGYFPETAEGVNEEFCFVHLDMDLYLPTLRGLEFFYPRLVPGGVLAVHDFFSSSFPNVKRAVYGFADSRKEKLGIFPLGDGISVGITSGH